MSLLNLYGLRVAAGKEMGSCQKSRSLLVVFDSYSFPAGKGPSASSERVPVVYSRMRFSVLAPTTAEYATGVLSRCFQLRT